MDEQIQLLQSALRYDPETGIFYWKIKRTRGVLPGDVAGSQNPKGYVRICLNGKFHSAHRVAWVLTYGKWPSNFIDHRDGDPSNNKLENLREATATQNQANRRKKRNGSSQFKGVTFNTANPNKPWSTRIATNKKTMYLGCYKTEHEASEVYLNAAKKLHGDFFNNGKNTRHGNALLEQDRVALTN